MTTDSSTPPVPPATGHYWHPSRLVLAWVIALIAALAAVLWAPAELRGEWLVMSAGIGVLATFALQLGTAQREGFIARTSLSVGGVVVLVGLVGLGSLAITGSLS